MFGGSSTTRNGHTNRWHTGHPLFVMKTHPGRLRGACQKFNMMQGCLCGKCRPALITMFFAARRLFVSRFVHPLLLLNIGSGATLLCSAQTIELKLIDG